MGWFAFGILTRVFAVKARFEIDEEQTKLMQARWEGRNTKQVRVRPPGIDQVLLEHAKLQVFGEMGRKSALMRTVRMEMAESVRKAARARWRQHRQARNGHRE